MKLNGNQIKPGNVIEHKSRLWVAVKTSHVTPGKGGAFAQIELRDVRDGTKLNERFRSSETVERVILEESEHFLFYSVLRDRGNGFLIGKWKFCVASGRPWSQSYSGT